MTSTIDSLPKQFVSAMRTLFDIMDDKRTGYVNFSEIENRWKDDGSKSLPKGVIESLRKLTPPNGLLSFERFCAGLKICLLRNQVDQRNQPSQSNLNRPPSAPLLDIEDRTQSKANWGALKPSVISQQRTISMPLLLAKNNESTHDNNNNKQVPNLNKTGIIYGPGPPKPPRSTAVLDRQTSNSNIDRAEIRTALQNWQMGLLLNDQRSLGDGKADLPAAAPATVPAATPGIYQKKPNVRRREPRRHTLQNGIDYNMLKRMKQIEQEKDVLMQGLNGIEKAREWYLTQIGIVQEKMKYLGRMGHVEQWTEAQQERLELQRARVLEVNRHLAALTDSWERGGLPLHMNLAVHHYHPTQQHPDLNTRLKQQNHLLTEEVSKKSDRISVLEREKASLIRELLQVRTPNRNNQDEAVF